MWFSGFVLHQAQGIPWWRAPQQPTPRPRGSGSASHSAVHACACPPWGLHPAVVALSKTPIEAGRSERCVCSYTLKRKAWIFLSGTTRRVNTVSALPGKLEDWHWPCSFFRASIPGLSENRDLHWDQAGLNVPNKRGWYQCERVLTHAALGCAQGKHPHQQWPGGLETSGLCRWRPGGNRNAVRKDEFAPRRLVHLLNQTREQCQEFFTHLHPSLISSTNALAELKSIDV